MDDPIVPAPKQVAAFWRTYADTLNIPEGVLQNCELNIIRDQATRALLCRLEFYLLEHSLAEGVIKHKVQFMAEGLVPKNWWNQLKYEAKHKWMWWPGFLCKVKYKPFKIPVHRTIEIDYKSFYVFPEMHYAGGPRAMKWMLWDSKDYETLRYLGGREI